MPMNKITVEAIVNKNIETVWDSWNNPAHITNWAFALDTWEAPHAENDLKVGGKFLTRMQEKTSKEGFDLVGTYTAITPLEHIAYTMEDNRTVEITFTKISDTETKITETFDPETINPEEMQRGGWQAILNNFKAYTESLA